MAPALAAGSGGPWTDPASANTGRFFPVAHPTLPRFPPRLMSPARSSFWRPLSPEESGPRSGMFPFLKHSCVKCIMWRGWGLLDPIPF